MPRDEAAAAVAALLDTDSLIVTRVTPSGRREIDVRAALVALSVDDPEGDGGAEPAPGRGDRAPDCAILTAVVRQTTPTVRPDDVLGALGVVAGLTPPVPVTATRLAQGLLDDSGHLADPLGSVPVTRA